MRRLVLALRCVDETLGCAVIGHAGQVDWAAPYSLGRGVRV